MSNLVVERRGDATWVGIDRPEVRNALDRATVDALHEAISRASSADGPSVLVIHSTTAGTFVAGADIAELAERGADDALQAINVGIFERIEAYRWPTIAAIDGPALGGGCELALACDLRVVAAQALLFESNDKDDRMGAFLARRNRPRTEP